MKILDMPDFANESEEAAWWFLNQDLIADMFREDHPLPPGKTVLQLLVDSDDLALANERARAKGITEQKYMRDLVHRALHEEAA